ncbi:hypothetical protein AgCh_039644 [Apium graveolens]
MVKSIDLVDDSIILLFVVRRVSKGVDNLVEASDSVANTNTVTVVFVKAQKVNGHIGCQSEDDLDNTNDMVTKIASFHQRLFLAIAENTELGFLFSNGSSDTLGKISLRDLDGTRELLSRSLQNNPTP